MNASLWVRHNGKERVVYEYPECYGDYSEFFKDWRVIDERFGELTLPSLVKTGVTVPVSKREAEDWLFIQNI